MLYVPSEDIWIPDIVLYNKYADKFVSYLSCPCTHMIGTYPVSWFGVKHCRSNKAESGGHGN